jgi:hypothetical protein
LTLGLWHWVLALGVGTGLMALGLTLFDGILAGFDEILTGFDTFLTDLASF